MKYAKKTAASFMAAAMICSLFGTAAGAVDFTVVGDSTSNTAANTSSGTAQTAVYSSAVQNAVPEFFNGCVKFTWTAVPGAVNYVVKICNTDGTVVRDSYCTSQTTAIVVPETVFDVEHNSKKEFYACVIALKSGETDYAGTTFYAPSASKFTVESDMSKYPEYGAPQKISFMVNKGKLYITWVNPNDFGSNRDIFLIDIVDSRNKSVFNKTITDTNVEVKGLKDGQSYTVKIVNKTFSALSDKEFTFESDVKSQTAGTNKDTTERPLKGSNYTLPAPLSISAKAGDGKVTLTWSSVDEADGYRIYIYNSKTKKYETYKTIKGTKRTIKELTNGSSYKFRVAAVRYDESTKKYVPGTASRTVKVTPKKPSKSVKTK